MYTLWQSDNVMSSSTLPKINSFMKEPLSAVSLHTQSASMELLLIIIRVSSPLLSFVRWKNTCSGRRKTKSWWVLARLHGCMVHRVCNWWGCEEIVVEDMSSFLGRAHRARWLVKDLFFGGVRWLVEDLLFLGGPTGPDDWWRIFSWEGLQG